ncbi:MAG TPA: hypothetical protein VFJ30_18620 [Phycisphaerae bacterium]|nr:hypothetical protein [Phycisphaerae bacterium]
MNVRATHWIIMVAMAALLSGCLRVREISPVPPPVGLDHARVVIVNDGDRTAEVELIHSELGRFRMAETLQPGQTMIRDVPSGDFDGMEAIPTRPGVMRTKRDDLKLDGGKSYEWRVGKKD